MATAVDNFLKVVRDDCKVNNVQLILEKGKSVQYGSIPTNGLFETDGDFVDGDRKTRLSVAMGKTESEWLKTLVHEFSHMQQWKENCDIWKGMILSKVLNADTVMESWLAGSRYTEKTLDRAFDAMLKVELDCEMRAVRAIARYKLPIDPVEYIQRANAYVLFYKVIRKYKQWYTIDREPYNLDDVWMKMPKTFRNIYDLPLSAKHEKLLLKCFD